MRVGRPTGGRRGSALVLAIVLSVVVAGLVMVLAWGSALASQAVSNEAKLSGAYYAAEAGVHRVAWHVKHGSVGSLSSPLTGSVGGYSYSTSWTSPDGASLAVRSTGWQGGASSTVNQVIGPPSPPVYACAGDFDNKNIQLVGNMSCGGNYTNGGNGSLKGNLIYGGTATSTVGVTGSVTKGAFTPIDFVKLGETLAAAAQQTFAGSQTGVTFNFDMLTGTNKVIMVSGDVSSPRFVGTGTLYVVGKVTTGAFGTSSNPVNIVATDTITTNNNIAIYGGIYTAAGWNRGSTDLTGLAYVGGIAPSNSGASTMTQGLSPWFDPRGNGNVTSMTTFSEPDP